MATMDDLKYQVYLQMKKAGQLNPGRHSINSKVEEEVTEKESPLNKRPHLFKEDHGKIVLTTDEKIYAGSYGIDPVLVRLSQYLKDQNCKMNTVLLNVCTCIRNAMDKTLSNEYNVKKVGQEISYVVETISDMFEKSIIKNPYLVLYMSNYQKEWPAEKLRPVTPGRLMYFDLMQEFYHVMGKNGISKVGKTTVNAVKLDKNMDYAGQLYSLAKNISDVIPSASYTGEFCLISHQPLDFHVLNKCPNAFMISSHTGEVVNKKMLGYKVFGEQYVPFNMLTHALLGDKYQIKPSVSIKARKDIKEAAFKNKWYLKTDAQVKQDLRNIGIIIT